MMTKIMYVESAKGPARALYPRKSDEMRSYRLFHVETSAPSELSKYKIIVGAVALFLLLTVVACAAEQPAVKSPETPTTPTIQPTTTSLPLSDEQILTQHPDDLDAALEELEQAE